MKRVLAAVVVLACGVGPVGAFHGHAVTEGPLTLTIGEVAEVTTYNKPCDVPVTLKNTGAKALAVKLTLTGLVDEWRGVGPTEKDLTVPAGSTAAATFRIAAGAGAYPALYPVRVHATFQQSGKPVTVRAVRVFATKFSRNGGYNPAGDILPLNDVPSRGALGLATLRTGRVTWNYFGGKPVHKPVGWRGSDETSRASVSAGTVARGDARQALTMHPPYHGGKGTVFAEYRLRLPNSKPLQFVSATAIRDTGPNEPPSDGVTFRVWAGDEVLYEKHHNAKVWQDVRVDLSRFAGREILLRLESHPGPKQDTTCDSCFWAEPTILAGAPPRQLTPKARTDQRQRARRAVHARRSGAENEYVFKLSDGYAAAVIVGPNGLADAALAFGRGELSVVLDGIEMDVLGAPVGTWPSAAIVRQTEVSRGALTGSLTIVHHCELAGQPFDVTAKLWTDGPALRMSLASPKRLTDVAPGPTDQKAPRVFYGHGYCVVNPRAGRVHYGGHGLATSHVGFDFANGVSLLTATDDGPDSLQIDPDRNVYALHAHEDVTYTFLPSLRGAFDAAIRYRPIYKKRPAPGVKRKAGRFVFDIWGGRYSQIAEQMREAFAYGLTDSMLIAHVWQRWGYDYRLPDIYPPNPQFGTLAELQEVGRLCRERDVPWGLHDNYIDFYPDADGYSYDHICFGEGGGPIKAWINLGPNAQSYRWRPDRFMPFLQRNLAQIKPALQPTAYFLDVFTSSGAFDFYDRDGRFHPKSQTRRHWGEAFAHIRKDLGGNAPTVSEAGADHLIGTLDGADCQLLQLSDQRLWHYGYLPCKRWQIVPWFDAVHHERFSLHGVGYSSRYQGQRSRRDHGIESDDYITAEILTGHALMADRVAMGRGAVRKYWLAQDFIRSIARDSVSDVEFAGGDMDLQVVTWKSGAKVYVNRSATNWTVGERTLPPYGYLASNGEIESCIEKLGRTIVEWSRAPGRFYVNGRGTDRDAPLQIRPSAGTFEHVGGRKFILPVQWDVQTAAPRDLHVWVHFQKPIVSRLKAKEGTFMSSHGGQPTSKWSGRVTTGGKHVFTIPETCTPGRYNVLVGLWDPKDQARRGLLGEEFDTKRYRIGAVIVEASKGEVTSVRLDTEGLAAPAPYRHNAGRNLIDFGPAVTAGAFRCEMIDRRTVVLTPLPDEDAMSVTLRLQAVLGRAPTPVLSVLAVDQAGKILRTVPFQSAAGAVSFKTQPTDFAYHIALE